MAPPTPWEIAKPFLEKDILEGRIKDHMFPREVKLLRIQYENCGKGFGSNYRRLQKTMGGNEKRGRDDLNSYLHDISIKTLAKDMANTWHGSEAETKLKEDVKRKRHLEVTPKQMWDECTAYQKFHPDVVRAHIHQEVRSGKETQYWIVKKQKKEARKAKMEEMDAQKYFIGPKTGYV